MSTPASNEHIIFYDIPSTAPGCAWSPSTWKVRYALNYKGLAYKTVWVEYPDIADLCKKIGAEPAMICQDGTPHYTLPVIQDPKTGTVLSESLHIAEYLDSTYPDTPKVIPTGTFTLQKSFQVSCDQATNASTQFIIPAIAGILLPRSKEYYVRTREVRFGKKLSDVVPAGEAHETAWKEFEEGLGRIDSWMKEEDLFIMGDTPSFADLAITGKLQWFRKGFGEDSDKWKDIMAWHGGRWAKLLNNLKKYEGPADAIPAYVRIALVLATSGFK
ncbi:glutathione S-transferase [Mycena galericulata]|nr:glutathione S-transferase [Mycena galericulata]